MNDVRCRELLRDSLMTGPKFDGLFVEDGGRRELRRVDDQSERCRRRDPLLISQENLRLGQHVFSGLFAKPRVNLGATGVGIVRRVA